MKGRKAFINIEIALINMDKNKFKKILRKMISIWDRSPPRLFQLHWNRWRWNQRHSGLRKSQALCICEVCRFEPVLFPTFAFRLFPPAHSCQRQPDPVRTLEGSAKRTLPRVKDPQGTFPRRAGFALSWPGRGPGTVSPCALDRVKWSGNPTVFPDPAWVH